jgi:hypothetical protein
MALGHIRKPFADGDYPFALGGREIQELERLTGVGPMDLYRRLLGGGWFYGDVINTVRLGLVCAGRLGLKGLVNDLETDLSPIIAARLVDEYVASYAAPPVEEGEVLGAGPRPWAESALLAAEILGAGVAGFVTEHTTEPLGKKKSIDPAE